MTGEEYRTAGFLYAGSIHRRLSAVRCPLTPCISGVSAVMAGILHPLGEVIVIDGRCGPRGRFAVRGSINHQQYVKLLRGDHA